MFFFNIGQKLFIALYSQHEQQFISQKYVNAMPFGYSSLEVYQLKVTWYHYW